MTNWVWGTSLSYRDFLQAKEFERTLTYTVKDSSRSIVATIEQARTGGAELLQSISAGFEEVTLALDSVREGLADLQAEFHWGFSELLIQTGRMNDTLARLVGAAETPAQTWAYEQFAIARDAVRRGLHREALESLSRAIEGHGSNPGYRLDHRFHELRAVIHIGSFTNSAPELVDPPKAEHSFLEASRFAAHDLPLEAARALVGASWAAYVQGELGRAVSHARAAHTLNPTSGEVHFHLSKYLMDSGDASASAHHLKEACRQDRRYAMKASGDGSFQRQSEALEAVLATLRDQALQRAAEAVAVASADIARASRLATRTYRLPDHADLSTAETHLRSAHESLASGTYYGGLDASQLARDSQTATTMAVHGFVHTAGRLAHEVERAALDKLVTRRAERWRFEWVFLIAVSILVSTVLGFKGCIETIDSNGAMTRARQQAARQMQEDVRRSGYDPDQLSIDSARKLGWSLDDLPPPPSKSPIGVLLGTILVGGVLSYAVSAAMNFGLRQVALSRLERPYNRATAEREALDQVLSTWKKS